MGPAAEYKDNRRGIRQSFESRVYLRQDVQILGSDSAPSTPAADYNGAAVILRNTKNGRFKIQNV